MKITEKAQEMLEVIVSRFESGDLSPVQDVIKIRRNAKDQGVPMNRWSFLNQLGVYLTKGTTDARGYNQWKKVGRKVKKGSKATYILAPVFIKKTEERNGEEVEYQILVGFKAVPVFAIEDTEGDELPTFDYEPKEPPALVEVAQALGIPVKYTASDRPALGCYRPGTDQIELYSQDEEVWFHELGHAIHKRIGFKDYNFDEVVAELTSTVLSMVYAGKDITGNAWKYIKAYSDNPIDAVRLAMKDVEKVLDFIDSVGVA